MARKRVSLQIALQDLNLFCISVENEISLTWTSKRCLCAYLMNNTSLYIHPATAQDVPPAHAFIPQSMPNKDEVKGMEKLYGIAKNITSVDLTWI